MRYIYKKIEPEIGDKRIVVKFAWRPITIGEETRRWEMVIIEQEYKRWNVGEFGCYHSWNNERFIDSIPEGSEADK